VAHFRWERRNPDFTRWEIAIDRLGQVGKNRVVSASSEPRGTGGLTLSDVVERTGVPASTIHYYRRNGLIPAPTRLLANRFVYEECHVEAILRIRAQADSDPAEGRARIVAAAIDAFKTRSYAEVSVSDIAEAANMAKGNVYRYFPSKEALLTASIETLLVDTTERFQSTLDSMGGPEELRDDGDKLALLLGYVVADVLPMLLELGSRAAKGHEASDQLARKVLRTLAQTAGQPFVSKDQEDDEDAAVQAGLQVIQSVFGTVLTWAVGSDWPPDDIA
jgi:AcrR family transcriptional regulator